MTSRPKSRRKKPIEALDWRQLADAPALRGLTDVLSPLSVRGDEESTTAGESPSEGESPTEGISLPSLPVCVPPTEYVAPFPDVSPTEGELPTEGEPPGSPSVGDTTTVGTSAFMEAKDLADSVGVKPSEGDTVSEVEPTSEKLLRQSTVETPSGGVQDSAGLRPSVGETPAAVESPGSRPREAGWWATSGGARFEGKRVQRVAVAEHSMSLGEERVYQTLWNATDKDGVTVEGRESKVFTLGYDRIARLVRLNEKSVRLLMPKLIAKRILEVIAAEHSAGQIGRTYRIFSGEKILARQRAADLTTVVKNGRAVEFVWPVDCHRG